MTAEEIPGISMHRDWGSGIINKGIRSGREYKESCERALNIAKYLSNQPSFLTEAWKVAQVRGNAQRSVAALALWLARGRKVHDAKDGVRADGYVEMKMEKLLKLINEVESVLGLTSKKDTNVCLYQKTEQNSTEVQEFPSKDDIEKAETEIRKSSEEIVDLNAVLNQLETNFDKQGRILKKNWRMITKRNIEFWFGEQ